MNTKVLVKNIRTICRRKGISIMRMEEDLGFSPGLISRWSKTKTSPYFDKVADIVQYLDVSFEDLMEEEAEEDIEEETYFRQETEGRKPSDADGEDLILYKKLAVLTEQKKICWKKGHTDEEIVDFPIEKAVDIRKYSQYEYYCYKCNAGYFVLVVQYNEYLGKLNTSLYVMADSLADPIKENEENCKYYEQILKYADPKFYSRISRARAEHLKEVFMNMDFSKVAGMQG
ncbi:MAG: helix-turn-helix transcriptional regulator [Eubacteriales bacterium]|nr:helix-turn-helix transcriptional regulator [Eubacteriales bacterium]